MNEKPNKKEQTSSKAKLFSLRYLFYDFVKLTAALPGLLWFRPKWLYESRAARKRIRGGCLLIANHNGFFDPICVMLAVWYRRHRFVCDKIFFTGKKRWLFQHFLCIPVDRENVGMDTLRTIAGELKSGSLVSLFPEGHIAREEESGQSGVAAFKSGAVLMALQGKVPIVPVYCRQKPRFWSRLRIAVGEPIDIIERYGPRPSLSQIEQISEELRAKEQELAALANGRAWCLFPDA